MLGWLNKIVSWWKGRRSPEPGPTESRVAEPSTPCRLERIILTDGVARTLFEDYTDHRDSPRGDEEVGWILLGLRQEREAIALAALPAGTQRDAGSAHIRFNSDAQALASRIVRQKDKRLQIIGVVHTHPGTMRWPSDGDFHGDSQWVGQLRGGEGVFGIGTADVRPNEATSAHVQVFSGLCFSWYALGSQDNRYRLLPVQVALGPDLALPLRPVWGVIENFAQAIDRLCRQFAKVQLEVIDEDATFSPTLPPSPSFKGTGAACLLCVKIALTEPKQQLRLLLNEAEARYYWEREGELIAIDPHEPQPDRAVYLILAELAKEPAATACETIR
jgi:proteasome lid subunit RPN8/RPN11